MNVTLKDIINLTKELPEKYYEEVFENLTAIKEKVEAEKEEESKIKLCPHCDSRAIVRNGKRHGQQAYICRNCDKTFTEKTNSAVANSHASETVWKQVIRDTVNGVAIDETADSLELHHSTVFNMRHKILVCIENDIAAELTTLEGVCELDETYVLENEKGRKFPENYHRKPRKHGAKASKPGISNEYICVCAGVNSAGKNIAYTVNRAAPSQAELEQVFADRIVDDTIILCDGNKNYNTLDDKCTVAHVKHPNKVNGLHSYIKERIRAMRGVSTIYQNRYNALFSEAYNNVEVAVSRISKLMFSCDHSFLSIADVRTHNLLNI